MVIDVAVDAVGGGRVRWRYGRVVALRIQVLGPVRAWRDGEPVELGRVGQRAVLGLLALGGGQPLSRAELVDSLWGDTPPPSAANVIQTSVKHLRRLLEPARP